MTVEIEYTHKRKTAEMKVGKQRTKKVHKNIELAFPLVMVINLYGWKLMANI